MSSRTVNVNTQAIAVLLSLGKTARITHAASAQRIHEIEAAVSNILSGRAPSDVMLMRQHTCPLARDRAESVRIHLSPHERALCGLLGLLNSLMWANDRRSKELVQKLKNRCAAAEFVIPESSQNEASDPPPGPPPGPPPDPPWPLPDPTTEPIYHRSELDASMACMQRMLTSMVLSEAAAARSATEAQVARAAQQELAAQLKKADSRIQELLSERDATYPHAKRHAC